ncbi:hypothetical protein H257_09603 [Aphanomyces astaci]|uniref:Uncharacterized protein n=1 Tax=Aphanomyces astaci TaxID=112090 RepID=W4GAR2_APHAT|nr:hypothetical protein H257_09603 [Aphanomyces astaci]ETV76038.1 hypothetical protein H257_09603 [Aphanomyces astaci]|eukprot:XP_009834163.1 hypothetical protein H257_09603 [Aphanomyces astaci]
MTTHLYSTARTSSDYQDAALINLLWYLFGRASDLCVVRKQNITIDGGGVFFMKFIRMKTREELGISLFPDNEFQSCPPLAIGLLLMSHVRPIPRPRRQPAATNKDVTCDPRSRRTAHRSSGQPWCHCAIKRHRHQGCAKLYDSLPHKQLTSHSVRRGDSQHENAVEHLSSPWIFDRGLCTVSATNKAFNYVFNTSLEDHKVAKTLSGWAPTDTVKLASLSTFDVRTKEQIDAVLAMASRLETCVVEAGCALVDVLAWSSHLVEVQGALTVAYASHQAMVIEHFIENARLQNARMDVLEAHLNSSCQPQPSKPTTELPNPRSHEHQLMPTVPQRKKSSTTHPNATWFEWYALQPRLWESKNEKQKKSNSKLLVAFMKLFLEHGFVLDPKSPTYRDDVNAVGRSAEINLLGYLPGRGVELNDQAPFSSTCASCIYDLNDKIVR